MIPYAISINYMIAGYSVIFFILVVYFASLILRWRRLIRDLKMLEDMKKRLPSGNQ